MDGQTALITGSARGIGFGIAECLAREGSRIVLNDVIDPAEAEPALESIRQLGVEAAYIRADISKAGDRNRLLEHTKSSMGNVHILVNNAGVAPEKRTDILEATESSFERVMRINLQGPYFLTQSVARQMIENRKRNPESRCYIVNIASSNSSAASVNRGEYCISKAGVSMATKLWAVRLAEFEIPVYEIRPGIIQTPMTKPVTKKYDTMIEEGLLLQKRWGMPLDVGKAVAMLARGDLQYSTGQIIYVDGGQLVDRL